MTKIAGKYIALLIIIAIVAIIPPTADNYITNNPFTAAPFFQPDGQTETLSIRVASDQVYELDLPENVEAFKLSGSITGDGVVRVYLQSDEDKILILDSESVPLQTVNLLTGTLAIGAKLKDAVLGFAAGGQGKGKGKSLGKSRGGSAPSGSSGSTSGSTGSGGKSGAAGDSSISKGSEKDTEFVSLNIREKPANENATAKESSASTGGAPTSAESTTTVVADSPTTSTGSSRTEDRETEEQGTEEPTESVDVISQIIAPSRKISAMKKVKTFNDFCLNSCNLTLKDDYSNYEIVVEIEGDAVLELNGVTYRIT